MKNDRELWISQIYFPMENSVDRVHGAWTERRGSGPPWTEAVWWCLVGARRVGARARWCSPSVVEEDEAVPEGCSPEHERRHRGCATEAKNGGGLSSARG
jgi:hypothetical protein